MIFGVGKMVGSAERRFGRFVGFNGESDGLSDGKPVLVCDGPDTGFFVGLGRFVGRFVGGDAIDGISEGISEGLRDVVRVGGARLGLFDG